MTAPDLLRDAVAKRNGQVATGVAYHPGWVELFRGQQVVDLGRGAGESLPLADAMADAVSANGAFNLAPGKEPAQAEAFRVLKPGSRLTAAEIVLRHDVPLAERGTLGGWYR